MRNKKREYTVIATSGWQGDGWHLIGIYDNLSEARRAQRAIYTTDARSCGHITAICGQAKTSDRGEFAYEIDTSRINVSERHLRNKRCLVDAVTFITGDGPTLDLILKTKSIEVQS